MPQAPVQRLQLDAHLHAQLRVEVRQRLVEQEHRRLAHDRAAHRDALALAAGERARLAVEERAELEDLRRALARARRCRRAPCRRILRPYAMFSRTDMCG